MKQKLQSLNEKIIAIGGGVGPMAGVELHKKIIENTVTDGTDQDHIEIYHLSRSHDIKDRTAFLLGKVSENPAEGMIRTVQTIEKASSTINKEVVLGIPCSTFYAADIFKSFLNLLNQSEINVKVLNMIEEVGKFIHQSLPDIRKVGLMTTTGARKFRVYNEVLENYNYEIIEIPAKLQEELHDSIYDSKWGLKAKYPVSETARDNFIKYLEILCNEGVEAIILGCTEIPLALPEPEFNGIVLIDPMFVLARALIREANKNKLKPLDIKL